MQPDRQIVLITGATGAIGKAIAENIAGDKIYHVVLVVRDEKKAAETADKIRWNTGNENIEYKIVDLSDHKQIYRFAGSWEKPVEILINNAAATPRRREENKYGIELQFATNVLGYFSMMEAFTSHLSGSLPTRIINVASYWAFKSRRYDNNDAYRQSKQANRMLSVAFADRLKDQHIFVNACHPGDVNSKLSNDLGFGGHETPDQGADTPVWLATHSAGIENTGKYFEHRRETVCRFSQDKESINRLYETCAEMIERIGHK
jgi:NAD(P)-dependent dehydrogenase (short-subunit alcohol dehydrogenase family)